MYCKHNLDLFSEVKRELYNNLPLIYIGEQYRESKYFREACLKLVYNICELNPTNMVGHMIHEI